MASATLSMGMVQIPFGVAKASTTDAPDLKSVCECGSPLGYMADDDGNKVACQDDDCTNAYSWWNQAPGKAFELGDDLIELSADEVDAAAEAVPVDTGNVEKVCEVGDVLLHYGVEGNYYLLPEAEFADQYGALVAALNAHGQAILTYLRFRSKTRRYAVVSRGGVLLALQLADKKAIPDLDYGTDESMEEQAATMLDSMTDDDPALDDVEGHGLKELVREKAGAGEGERAETAIAPEV